MSSKIETKWKKERFLIYPRSNKCQTSTFKAIKSDEIMRKKCLYGI
jgi:hypothetical protein